MQITLTKEELLKRIKETVLSIDPGATVMLYGSRARGDAEEDSDWDILVLTDSLVDYAYQSSIWNALFALELEFDEEISAAFMAKSEWSDPILRSHPFNRNALRDGIEL